MTSLRELDLPNLPMEDPAFAQDPFPHFTAARRKHPWLATCSFGYVIHEYAAIRDLLMMDDALRGSYDGIVKLMGAQGTPWGASPKRRCLRTRANLTAACAACWSRSSRRSRPACVGT